MMSFLVLYKLLIKKNNNTVAVTTRLLVTGDTNITKSPAVL